MGLKMGTAFGEAAGRFLASQADDRHRACATASGAASRCRCLAIEMRVFDSFALLASGSDEGPERARPEPRP